MLLRKYTRLKWLIKICNFSGSYGQFSFWILLFVLSFFYRADIFNSELSKNKLAEITNTSEYRYANKPSFLKHSSFISNPTPVEVELNKRKNTKNKKAIRIKPTPRTEDYIKIKKTKELDTNKVKQMLKRHRSEIKIIKHKDGES